MVRMAAVVYELASIRTYSDPSVVFPSSQDNVPPPYPENCNLIINMEKVTMNNK